MENTEVDVSRQRQELGTIALDNGGNLGLNDLSKVMLFAELMQRANYLPKNVTREGAVIAICAGKKVGLDPFQSVQGFAVINGRPSLWGDAMTAVVKGAKLADGTPVLWNEETTYFRTEIQKDKDGKEIKAVVRYSAPCDNALAVNYKATRNYGLDKDGNRILRVYESQYTKSMAEIAGLMAKDGKEGGKEGTWKTNPIRMMFNRARAFALRDGFSDLLHGIGCVEEEADAAGIAVDVTKEAIISPSPATAPVAKAELPKARKHRLDASSVIASEPEAEPVEEHLEDVGTEGNDSAKDAEPAKDNGGFLK